MKNKICNLTEKELRKIYGGSNSKSTSYKWIVKDGKLILIPNTI